MKDEPAVNEVLTDQSPQGDLWLQEKKEAVENQCPPELQPVLFERLKVFENTEYSESEQKKEINDIEALMAHSIKLQQLLGHFEQELSQAAQSKATVETEVALFWAKFTDKALDPQEFLKLEQYLKDQYQKHAKENQVINEVNQKINEEIEPEMQSFLPYYFNSKDRGLIYAEMAKQGSVDAVNKYRQKILKAREKREEYVAGKLQEIWARKTDPQFGQKTLKLIQKKCGDGVFQLPHVQEAQSFVKNVIEAEKRVISSRQDLENDNAYYKDLTGVNHIDYKNLVAVNDNSVPEEPVIDERVKEARENKETQIKALYETRRLLKHALSFWARANPNLLDDASFSIAGGNRRKALLEKTESLPSVETYEDLEGKSATLAQAQDGTKGLWKYRTVDIPANAEDFTPEKAQALLGKLNTYTDGGGDMMVAMTGLWYIDMAKRGGAKAKSVSMNDYLAHIDHLLQSLGQPTVTEDDLADAA